MKLYFIGADHEVTGSCHIIEINSKYIMLDCGMEQGKDIYLNEDLPVPAGPRGIRPVCDDEAGKGGRWRLL